MAAKNFGPRKRRTRQHVIADLGVHHVEGFILDAAYTALRVYSDYGHDLVMYTFDDDGYCEPGLISLQIKASEELQEAQGAFVFDLDIRDYNLWTLEQMPVILILYDASRKCAYWLSIKHYFREDSTRQPRKGAKSVRVRVSKEQRLNRQAIAEMRNIKKDIVE